LSITPQRAIGIAAVAGIGGAAVWSLARTIHGSRETEVDDLHVRRNVRWGSDHEVSQDAPKLPDIPGQARAMISPTNDLSTVIRDMPTIGTLSVIGGAFIGASRGSGILGKTLGALGGGALGLAAVTGFVTLRTRLQDNHAIQKAEDRTPAPTTVEHPGEQLKVMTLNIREGMGPYDSPVSQDRQWDKIAAVVQAENPDILMLQEVSVGNPQTGQNDNVAELEKRLNPSDSMWNQTMTIPVGLGKGQEIMTFHGAKIEDGRTLELEDAHAPGTTMRRLLALVGVVSEVKHDTEKLTHLPLVMRGYHARGASDALIRTPEGNLVRAVSTHMSGAGIYTGGDKTSSLRTQMGPLMKAMDSWDGPTILGGDFNVNSRNATPAYPNEAKHFTGIGLTDAFTAMGINPKDKQRVSYPTHGTAIDRFWVDKNISVQDVHVVHDTFASDHDPVVTTVTVG
jgi:endonuclease/exonuclease/phosphatase family metal-dependent hydrolase